MKLLSNKTYEHLQECKRDLLRILVHTHTGDVDEVIGIYKRHDIRTSAYLKRLQYLSIPTPQMTKMILDCLQNPELIKELNSAGLKIDYVALGRMLWELVVPNAQPT